MIVVQVEGEEDDDGSKVGSHDVIIDGPDTSSFTAFLYSLWSSSDSGDNIGEADEKNDDGVAGDDSSLPDSATKESFVVKRSLFSRGRHSIGRAIHQASRMGGFRSRDSKYSDEGRGGGGVVEMKRIVKEPVAVAVAVVDHHLPELSEPSMLVSDGLRDAVYASLPALIHGRKWLLLYRYVCLRMNVKAFGTVLVYCAVMRISLKLFLFINVCEALGSMVYHSQLSIGEACFGLE